MRRKDWICKMVVTREDVIRGVKELGIRQGDVVLVHSSFKSLGPVEGGAETVVSGFLEVLGQEGTLVMPTLCQKDFAHSYETWHNNKPSDTGYLTEYFRKRPGSLRSDQATHSVAACGKAAVYLTEHHGHTQKRFGNMGDTPFSADSPWEKMYQMDAKIVMLGVTALYTTFRHYAEYVYIEECLKALEKHPQYAVMKDRLSAWNKPGVWPHVRNIWVYEQLEQKGLVTKSCCGNAELLCYSAREFVNLTLVALREQSEGVLWRTPAWDTDGWIAWQEEANRIVNKK
ncbi:MAG: AAC(3) family N-acetyltransferase [Lachnospiraceae bacterium]|nr:AAC(3) family N-acetyltransferase [Lachnospiraceae bacterium]